MKDFKKIPKMKTGGSVSKYASGGSTSDIDWRNVKPVEMPIKKGNSGINVPGVGEVKSVDMPTPKGKGTINVPGFGEVKPADMPNTKPGLKPLKTGGKVKRGHAKK